MEGLDGCVVRCIASVELSPRQDAKRGKIVQVSAGKEAAALLRRLLWGLPYSPSLCNKIIGATF